MDKRSNTRIVFNVSAVIELRDKTVDGRIANLSMKGVLVNTEEKIPVKSRVGVMIMMEGTSSQLIINVKGIVVRSEKNKTAIEFTSIDLDSYMHLKNIIIYNEGDEEKIRKEFFGAKKTY